MADPCAAAINAAVKGAFSPEQIQETIDDLVTRAGRRRAADPSTSWREAVDQAARGEITRAELDLAVTDWLRLKAAETRLARAQAYATWKPGEEHLALDALSVGTERGGEGRALSVDNDALAGVFKASGEIVAGLKKAGLEARLMSPWVRREVEFEKRVAREMARRTDPTLEGTGDKEAEAAAAVFADALEGLRLELNSAGAFIGRLPGYIVRQMHDAVRVRGGLLRSNDPLAIEAAFEKWRSVIEPRLAEKTFDGIEDRAGFLRAVWNGIVSGEHGRADDGADAWLNRVVGRTATARKLSEERVLHFQTPEAWFEYNEAFGHGSLIETVIGQIQLGKRSAALMRMWGPNPRAAYEADARALAKQAADRGDDVTARAVRSSWRQAGFDSAAHALDSAENIGLAAFRQGLTAQQILAKLGGVTISSIGDLALRAATLKHNGIGFLEGYTSIIPKMVEGMSSADRAEALDLMGAGIDGAIGGLTSRFNEGDSLTGRASKLTALFMRINVFTFWLSNLRRATGQMLAVNLARNAGKRLGELNGALRETLARYKIGEREWDLVRAHAAETPNGRKLLTADVVRAIPDDAIAAYAGVKIGNMQAAFSKRADQISGRLEEWDGWIEKLRVAIDALPQDSDRVWAASVVDRMKIYRNQLQRIRPELDRLKAKPERLESVLGQIRRNMETLSRREFGAGGKWAREFKANAGRIAKRQALLQKFEGALETAARLETDLKNLDRAAANREGVLIRDTRADLERRFQTYFTDQILDASTEPRAREKRITTMGLRDGTPGGVAARLFFLFKGFPLAIAMRHLARERFRGQHVGQLTAIAHLIVATTALGALSMTISDLAKGKTPRDFSKGETWTAAFLRGGGAGIYGDFLMGEYNRFGGGGFETLGGPVIGLIGNASRLFAALRDGDDAGARALRLAVGETPFLNVFYARQALDYAVLYELQELMNPGYLARMEKRMKRDQGQTFLMPPSEAIQRGAGGSFDFEGIR